MKRKEIPPRVRLKAYKYIIARFSMIYREQWQKPMGLCEAIQDFLSDQYPETYGSIHAIKFNNWQDKYNPNGVDEIQLFPEIYRRKPKVRESASFWFPMYFSAPRIRVAEAAIESLKKKHSI